MAPELNKVYQGDNLAIMKTWPDNFVDCVVTSPPYWSLRSYLPEGHPHKASELGGEDIWTYLYKISSVFSQVYRVLKPTGTLWLNIGDTYCTTRNRSLCPAGTRIGEKLNIPHKLSDLMRTTGWRLISEVVWEKPNANPHASGRRPIESHEPVFQFTKSEDNYYDSAAIQEIAKYQPDPARTLHRHARSVWSIPTVSLKGRAIVADFKHEGVYRERSDECRRHGTQVLDSYVLGEQPCTCPEVKDVDFFAAMPPDLAKRCILSSTSEAGNCGECGAPIKRISNVDRIATRPGLDCSVDPAGLARRDPGRHVSFKSDSAWVYTCDHNYGSGRRVPVVLDPFAGSGTTLVAAQNLGRSFLGIELNPVMVERLIPARLKKGK